MKKLLSRITASVLSVSMALFNAPVSYSEDEEPQLYITRMISGETSEYGLTNIKEIDENGEEVYYNLIPEWGDRAVMLPEAYDLRDYGYVTSVKSQGTTGTCWAHSTLASIESNMIKNGLADSTIDLSESHLVWFGNCRYSTDADDILYHEGFNKGADGYDDGGNYVIAVATLARWNGIQLQKNFADVKTRPSIDEKYRYTSYGYLKNSDYIDENDTESIKLHIMNTGALLASFASDKDYFSKNNISYYCPEKTETNHAITIIGWDDNYSKKNFVKTPATDGAWICKNSWGETWGDNGYFYLSYCDMTFDKVTSFEIVPTDTYDNIYQYDGIATRSLHFSSSGIAAANIFTAEKYETLKSVSFYTKEASVPYRIYVYSGVKDGSPTSGKLVYTENGTQQYAGYHVIDLTSPVYFTPGTKFSIVVAFEKVDASFVFDSGTNQKSSSYFTSYDISKKKPAAFQSAGLYCETDACIKAFTTSDEESIPGCVKSGAHTLGECTDNEDGTHDMICSVCGYIQTTEHIFSDWVTTKDGNHARACLGCGATETSAHTFGEWTNTKEGDHSHSCTVCGYTETGAHILGKCVDNKNGKHTMTCSTCGYIQTAEHIFGDWETTKDGKHTHSCIGCGYIETSAHTYGEWTATKDGKHTHNCTVCGASETSAHTYGEWTATKDGKHTHSCTVCGTSETSAHTYGEWTATKDGKHTHTCTVCGASETSAHTYGEWTATKDGKHTHSCTVCGTSETSAHTYGEWTATKDGKHTHSCTVCGATETSAHTYGEWTATKDGKHTHTCTVCGASETSAHTYGEWTATKDGKHTHSCTVCGTSETSAHTYGEWTATKDGKHTHTCTVCKYSESAEHNQNSKEINNKTHSYKCSDCGYTETAEHTFGKWTATKDDKHTHSCTCGYSESVAHNLTRELCKNGVVKYSCSDCEYTKEEKITYVKGDITGDKRIDVFDMIMFRKLYNNKLKNDTDIYALDMNEDLQFTIADLVSLNNYILNK